MQYQEDKSNPIFVLEFAPNEETSIPTRVWSYDIDKVNLFMKQHNFDPLNVRRYVIPGCDADRFTYVTQPDAELFIAHFKSNKSNDEINIITSDAILDDITRALADDMVDMLMFGSIVTRDDVAIIKEIFDSIEQLNHAEICDWDLVADDIVDRYYDEDYYLGISQYPIIPREPADTNSVYDSLFSDRNNNYFQPFTIEAYVHYFVNYIVGGIENGSGN